MRIWPFRRDQRQAIEDDVRDELASHVELRIQDNLRRGMTAAEAGREAAARFGPVAAVAVDCARIQRRRESQARSISLDVRAAWLAWRRAPLVSLLSAVVGAIGLATALGAALITDAAFLRQPPGMRVDDGVFTVLASRDGSHPQLMSYQQAQGLAAAAPQHQFFLWQDEEFQIDAGGRSALWPGVYAGGDYFKALGVIAAAGRLLDRDDETARRAVVVVSGGFARTLFGSAAAAAGQQVRVNGRPMQIVGVAGGGFRGGTATARADVWLPVTVEALLAPPYVFSNGRRIQGFVDQPDIGWLFGGVRLASPDERDSVVSRYSTVIRSAPRAGAAGEEEDRRAALLFSPVWRTPFTSDADQLAAIMKPIGIAVGLALVLAAVCVSSLLVGRLVHRQQELAIRLALGASRWRVLRLVITEHSIAVGAAAALALPLVAAILAAIERLQVAGTLRIAHLAVVFDARALLMLLALAAVLGVVSLIGPLAFARANTRAMNLTAARLVASGTRLRQVLMAAQVTAGCALLAGGGLLTKTINQLFAQPIGFDAAQVAYAEFDLAKAGLDDAARMEVLERLRARSMDPTAPIALTTSRFFPGIEYDSIQVRLPDRMANEPLTMVSRVEGPFFETLGIPVVAGRPFTSASRARHEVIVSRTFADQSWPGQNAIGRMVRVGGENGVLHEVVGVAASTIDVTLRLGVTRRIYLPLDGDSDKVIVVARRPRPRVAAATELVPLVAQIDERLAPKRSGILEDLALQSIEQRRLIRWMTLVVGTASLLMVAVGVWGLAHTSVSRRWREFGLRLAFGAPRRTITRLALRDAVIVAVTGVAGGVVVAWQFGRVLSSFLFGVAPSDPVVIATSAGIVAAAVFAGAWLPARRAASADPSQLLRTL